MSWSVNFIGKPQNVVNALIAESNKMSGQSKEEFDAALPHIVDLVKENIGENAFIKVDAAGHGIKDKDGIFYQKNCKVSIDYFYGNLV
jgi:hypothetical protein